VTSGVDHDRKLLLLLLLLVILLACTVEKENGKTIDRLMYNLSMRLRIQVAMEIFDNQTSREATRKKLKRLKTLQSQS
jgi:hypothetical protein